MRAASCTVIMRYRIQLYNQILLTGLAQAVRKNIERMTEVVVDSEYQSLQHFISHSPWEHSPVMDQVALDADHLLGGAYTGLIIDETSNPKKGKMSVVLARQWCGNLGKLDIRSCPRRTPFFQPIFFPCKIPLCFRKTSPILALQSRL
jgi:SRSO17 transposase